MAPDGCAFAPGRDKASFQPRTWKYYRQHRLRPRPVLESRIDRAPRTRTRLPRYLAVWRPSGLGLQSPLDEGQRNCSTSKRCMTTKRAVTWNGAWWKATGSCWLTGTAGMGGPTSNGEGSPKAYLRTIYRKFRCGIVRFFKLIVRRVGFTATIIYL